MMRRRFLQHGVGTLVATPLIAAVQQDKLEPAAAVLASEVTAGRIHAAALVVRRGDQEFVRSFGAAGSADAIFLLASISKPICIAAVMTLYDQGAFRLEDPVKKFIPAFDGEGREQITMRQLLTHVSGLPDQLPENKELRMRHAALSEFVDRAIRTPLLFDPGARYEYSSMAILLACEVAQRISGTGIHEFVDKSVFRSLGMSNSALGMGRFRLDQTMRCQVEQAAPEAGAGDPSAKDWDWNSSYWRSLGTPWGGVHGSAPDVAKFLAEFLDAQGKVVKPQTASLMISNQNRSGITSRGLGFDVGAKAGGLGCSELTFGHSGSTGTLAWADPRTRTICVALTTLPWRAANPHPAKLAADRVAEAVA